MFSGQDTRTFGHPDKLLVRISVNNGTESKNQLIPTLAIEDEERDPVQSHHGMTEEGLIGADFQGRLIGMTTNGYCEKARFRHSDKAPGRNLDSIASLL